MREILFRGKRAYNGKWVEGWLVIKKDPVIEVTYCFILAYGKGESFVTWYPVIPETVGQYTGLKDKNGKRIFDGDIVQIKDFTHGCALNYKQPTSKWVVHWREDTARFCIDYMSVLPFDFTKSEVIGNIHDNPELLEGGR